MPRDDRFLLRTNEDGSRQVSWRMWALVWVLPACFAGAVIVLALQVLWLRQVTVETRATVTHVYKWENDAPAIFYDGPFVYSPRYRYTWSDGAETEATAGTSHTDWDFEIGSRHTIRFHPDRKDDVILAGPTEWLVMQWVAMIGFCTVPFALIGTWAVRRWQSGGQQTESTVRRV